MLDSLIESGMFTKYYVIWAGTCIIGYERERGRGTRIVCMYLWEICVENESVMNTC